MAKFDLAPSGSFHQTVQAIVTVLAVINPVVCGSIFLMLTQQLDSDKRWRAAINVALSILAILVQGNRVKELCGDEACEEVVIPGGDFAAESEGILSPGSPD